jgi:hypothetical protein
MRKVVIKIHVSCNIRSGTDCQCEGRRVVLWLMGHLSSALTGNSFESVTSAENGTSLVLVPMENRWLRPGAPLNGPEHKKSDPV